MLRRLPALLVAFGAILVIALPVRAQTPDDGQREVRIVATAFKQELSQAESYESFRQAVLDHFDEHVAPLLADDRPNLVVYPERLDRIASLIGLRGRAARDQLADGADPGTARLALYGPYSQQVVYYRSQFQGLADTQYLQLALTDTVVRSVVETFSEVAERAGAHVVVGAALPSYEEATGPEAAVVGDPEARGGAYVATEPEVYAQTLVIGLDGEVVANRPRLVLTGAEASTSTSGDGLTPATFGDIRPVLLPFARLGVVAGHDVLVPDVAARLAQLGSQILVQPLSWIAWVRLAGAPSMWPPDYFERGTWLATQRFPEVRASATAVATGNFGSRVYDGQAVIATEDSAAGCLVGTEHRSGWAAVSGWTSTDLGALDPCAESSRQALAEVASTLWPGSGPPSENSYAHGAVAANVHLASSVVALAPERRVTGGDFASSVAADAGRSQLHPSVAVGPDTAWLAWTDTRNGHPRVYAAHSRDGEVWNGAGPVWPLGPSASHSGDQGQPSVVSAPPPEEVAPGLTVAPSTDAVVIHTVVDRGERDVYSSRHDATEDRWASRHRVDRAPSESFFGDAEDVLRSHTDPVLLRAPDGGLVAVWSDLRWPYVRPQVRLAATMGGQEWDVRTRVDGGPEDPDVESGAQPLAREPGETRGQVAPAATFTGKGRLLVAWQEPSPEGVASIYLAASDDGGSTFDAPRRVDGSSSPSFRPALAAAGDRVWLAWEDRTPAGGRRISWRRSIDGGRSWSEPSLVDPSGPDGVRQGSVAAVATHDGAFLVFEDDRAGDVDVLAVMASADGSLSSAVRVDDGPDGADARAPGIAVLADGDVLVVWQDDRDGVEQIRASVRTPIGVADETPQAPPLATPSPMPLPATGGGDALGVLGALLLVIAARLTRSRP